MQKYLKVTVVTYERFRENETADDVENRVLDKMYDGYVDVIEHHCEEVEFDE